VSDAVLDASAVLALLNGEPGHEAVAAVLPGAVLGAVNLAEVVSKLLGRGVSADDAQEAVRCLGVELAPYTAAQAFRTGELRPLTRVFGLSLGDRACLALAAERGATAITAERHWDERVAEAAGVGILRIRHAP